MLLKLNFCLLVATVCPPFKMVSLPSEKPIYVLHSVSQKFPQRCLWNSSNVRLIDDGPLSSPFKGDCLALPLSIPLTPGHRWRDVLGFVPTGSVSSSSTLQIFWEVSHLWGLLCLPVYLLGHFPSLRWKRIWYNLTISNGFELCDMNVLANNRWKRIYGTILLLAIHLDYVTSTPLPIKNKQTKNFFFFTCVIVKIQGWY